MKASRLLSILMTLQARGHRTADQLAEELEVSTRTIHRDVDELSAAGVPIYAERGRQGGFRLLDGYQTRLTGLDADEASVLMLSGIGTALDDLGLTDALWQTERKLMAALPEPARAKAALVANRFHLDPFSWYRQKEEAPFVTQIVKAVWADQRISIKYESWKGPIQRDLDAIAVVLKAGDWYLIGCAQTMRVYKIANIQSVTVLESKFERSADFDVSQFWGEWITSFEVHIRPNRARLRVTQKGQNILKSMGRMPIAHFPVPDQPDVTDIDLAVEGEANTVRQILSLGAEAKVIAPETLRLAVLNEVSRLAGYYCD
jgi:predicted DNA-binding transcriptional regulator YafY